MRREAVMRPRGFLTALGVVLLLIGLSGRGASEPQGALPTCPGPDLEAGKPGTYLSPETRFFAELQRLDGLLVRGQILQGCLLSERFAFEVETGRGPQRWEAPAGEVVGYLPARGDAPRVLVHTSEGFELRAGRLAAPLRVRLFPGEPAELALDAEDVEFFLLRGVFAQLPLPLQARVLERLIPAFQELHRTQEFFVLREGGMLAGEVRAPLLLETAEGSGSGRMLLPASWIKRLRVLPDGAEAGGEAKGGVKVRVELRDGRVVEGFLREALSVRVLGLGLQVPAAALVEVLFRDEALRFRGGGGEVRFCPGEPC